MRRRKPHAAVAAWLSSLEHEQVFFSAVTFGEIQKGVEITRQQDPAKANEIEVWARQLEKAAQVLPMGAACFQEYARLRHRRSETFAEDAMIAATARVHGLTVATRNVRHFGPLGVALLNPFRS